MTLPSAREALNSEEKRAHVHIGKQVAAISFEWPVRVYWEDTDAGGIVFYANYLKFFERARTEWLRSLGLGQHALREQTGGMFVVTDAQLKYLQAARLDDMLRVTACVQEVGRASLAMLQQAWLQLPTGTVPTEMASTSPVLLCEGRIRIGWVSADHLRPQRMPMAVRQALETEHAATRRQAAVFAPHSRSEQAHNPFPQP